MLATLKLKIARSFSCNGLSCLTGLLVGFYVSGGTGLTFAQEEKLELKPVAAWNVVFSGSEATYQFAIKGPEPHPTRASWSLIANDRTLARGEVEVQREGGQSELSIPLRFPETRPGVRFPLQLHLEAIIGDKTVSLEEQIILFPTDPFADRQRWLEEMQIVLYDPVGNTVDVFDEAKIPYQFLRTTSAIDEKAGLIVIGEGVSLETDRGLAEDLLQKVSKGAKIIFLAPAEGQIPVPGATESKLPRPARLSLRGEDVIADLDKQLAGRWAPGGKPELVSFQIHADRYLAVWQVDSTGDGWAWIDMSYKETGGRMFLCGLGLIDRWEEGPGPSYLMLALLDRLKTAHEPSSSKK